MNFPVKRKIDCCFFFQSWGERYIKKSHVIFLPFLADIYLYLIGKLFLLLLLLLLKVYLWPHLWPGVPLCLQTELLDLEDTLEARRSFGELLRETCKNSAKAGFLSTSSLVTCLAIMILLSPHWTHGTTSCLGSPISSNVFFRLSKAFLKAKICVY